MRYSPALDGIRAIAVMGPVAFHARVPALPGGFIGVDVFFVLSGFLITSLLVEERTRTGSIALRAFYLRRLLRLAPPLLFMLTAYLIAAPLLWPASTTAEHVRDAALAATYLSDYSRAFWGVPDVLRHTWSLSVEEHFYLLWPLVLLLVARLEGGRQVTALLALFLLATVWRQSVFLAGNDWENVYYRFDTRLSGVLLGALIAIAARHKPDVLSLVTPRSALAALAVLVGAASGFDWADPATMLAGITLVEVASAVLIIGVLGNPHTMLHRLLSSGPFVITGILSYGIYLWHFPLALVLRDHVPWYLVIAAVLPFSFACAALSYLTIERPAREMKKRNALPREPELTRPEHSAGLPERRETTHPAKP